MLRRTFLFLALAPAWVWGDPGLCNRREHRDEGGRGFFDAKSEVDAGTSDELFKEEKVRHPSSNAASYCKIRGEPITFSGAEISTGDPVILKGDFQPASSAQKPLLVLFHGLGSTAQEWGPLVRLAEKRGWGTLALDARGHGRSDRTFKGKRVRWDSGEMKLSLGRGMVEDALKALEAVRRDPKKNKSPLVLVGASVGANVALRASQGRTEVRCLVLLSPGLNYAGVATEDLALMTPHPVLMVAAQPDTYAFESVITLERRRPEWTSWRLPQGTAQGAHGVQLFNGLLEEDILHWIQKHLGE